jgi:hypothetical protein
MSHFAKVEDGIVTNVIVAEQDFIDTLPDADAWVQTSYNTRGGKHYADLDADVLSDDQTKALRKNYASIGFAYDADRDAFIPPKPYNSWLLDEDICDWYAPEPMPETPVNEKGQILGEYEWDEGAYNEGRSGWVLIENVTLYDPV